MDKTPTEPGWYWILLSNGWEIVQVVRSQSNSDELLIKGFPFCLAIKHADKTKWGPRVQPPEVPHA